MKVVRSLPRDAWREYVLRHPDGNIFLTPEMTEVFARTSGFEPELWAVAEGDEILALMIPVRVNLVNSVFARRLTTRAIAFGSALVAPGSQGREALSRLLAAYSEEARRGALFTELRNISDMDAFHDIFGEHRYCYEGHLNFLVDLARPAEEVFRGIGPRTRKNIRRALNRGCVRVRCVTEKEDLEACYEILSQSYRNASVPLATISLFEAAFEVLWPRNMIRFSLATVEERPLATSIDLLYKDTVFGWYGGTLRGGPTHAANEVLTWEVLKWGAENGYRRYDFGGAGRPQEKYGVRDFKAKFGGRLTGYGRYVCVHSPLLLRLSQIGYGKLRFWLYGRRRSKARGRQKPPTGTA
jgi:serine/alanine adding enzyme